MYGIYQKFVRHIPVVPDGVLLETIFDIDNFSTSRFRHTSPARVMVIHIRLKTMNIDNLAYLSLKIVYVVRF